MLHQQILLPEQHPEYPTLWRSASKNYRIIRCKDDIQFIVQQYKTPKWRGESYHVEWASIALIHGDKEAFNTLPDSI
jgi:hypothetical protein